MRVAVIGAGIVGVCSAHELAADGHEVTVFERRGSVAAESSFANAGLIAPGHAAPWAAPGVPWKLLRHGFGKHAPLRIGSQIDRATLHWLWRWWRACRPANHRANRARLHRLALYSQARLAQLRQTLQLDYERSQGGLIVLRTAQDLAAAHHGLAALRELGVPFQLLDATGCREVEPGLNSEATLHAGIHLPRDEAGNCRQFAMLMRDEALRRGVVFRLHTEVLAVAPGKPAQVTSLHAPTEESSRRHSEAPQDTRMPEISTLGPETESFDAVVVCAALGASSLLNPLGLRLPLMAVHGYSVTAPVRQHEAHPHIGPRAALIDDHHSVTISRMGNRLRVSGGAELGSSPLQNNRATLATLYKVLNDWYPGAAHMSQAQVWKGARPMLPDGPPVLGASGLSGLWLNLGHGANGWALACGSARIVADAIARRSPAIDLEGLGLERLQH